MTTQDAFIISFQKLYPRILILINSLNHFFCRELRINPEVLSLRLYSVPYIYSPICSVLVRLFTYLHVCHSTRSVRLFLFSLSHWSHFLPSKLYRLPRNILW